VRTLTTTSATGVQHERQLAHQPTSGCMHLTDMHTAGTIAARCNSLQEKPGTPHVMMSTLLLIVGATDHAVATCAGLHTSQYICVCVCRTTLDSQIILCYHDPSSSADGPCHTHLPLKHTVSHSLVQTCCHMQACMLRLSLNLTRSTV
jgi:hypothetical protein